MIDNIFGNLPEPENRLARHLENLNGVKHRYQRSPLDPFPGQPIILELTTGGPIPYEAARCFFTLDGTDPALPAANVLDLEPAAVKWDDPAWGYVRSWTVGLPSQPAGTLIRYHLAARRLDTGQWVYADTGSGDAAGADDFALWVDDDPIPSWAREALVYQIFPDRFYPGDGRQWNKVKSLTDFYGGTLRGMIDKLDYIQSLGFNTIWLNPFFKTTTHHGYNASDYYTVEPRLGTNADLKELIEKAHERGMRLLLDFVANHWSKDHFTFQDAQKNPDSPYHNWYFWNHWPDDYECYFKVRELPKINLAPGPAREYMLDVARHWLREGFDGYRLDFAYGPPHDFWVDFRRACREVKPDCWIFGEVIHTAEWLRSYTGILDGTLDFYLASALRDTFAQDRMSLGQFEAFLEGHERYFPANHIRPAFIDNHDEARFLYIAGDDKAKLRLAALVLYTLPGPPIVYNGTECGVTQERPMGKFEETRQPVKWDADADAQLLDYFRRLGQLRNEHPVVWQGSRRTVHIADAQETYAYLRENGEEKVLVAVNTSPSAQVITVKDPGFTGKPVDILNDCAIEQKDGHLVIPLSPQGSAFITV